MEDGVVGIGTTQLDDFGRHVHAGRWGDDFGGNAQTQALCIGTGGFHRVTAEFGVGVHQGNLGTRLGFGDVLQQDAHHLAVVGADHELQRVFLFVAQFFGKRGACHQHALGTLQLGVDGAGKTGGVAVVQIDLVLAGNFFECSHRLVHFVGGVFRHVTHLAAFDAALLVQDRQIVFDALVHADAGKREHAGHGNRAAQHNVFFGFDFGFLGQC